MEGRERGRERVGLHFPLAVEPSFLRTCRVATRADYQTCSGQKLFPHVLPHFPFLYTVNHVSVIIKQRV